VAAEAGVDAWQVAHHVDTLHDDLQRVSGVPDVTSEQRALILAGYARYLGLEGPPDGPLHRLLATEAGVTPRQVYRVLLEHRWASRR
jgi:hypothetical protein